MCIRQHQIRFSKVNNFEVLNNLQSRRRKSSSLEKSRKNYPNLKIDKDEILEEQDIFEATNTLSEGPIASKFVKFEAKLDVTKKKKVKIKS